MGSCRINLLLSAFCTLPNSEFRDILFLCSAQCAELSLLLFLSIDGHKAKYGRNSWCATKCWEQLSCCCCHSSQVLFLTQLPPTRRWFRACELLHRYHVQQIPSTKLLLQHVEHWHQLNELVVRPATIWWNAAFFLRSSWAILTEIALIKPIQTLSDE